MNLRHPDVADPFRLVDTIYFVTDFGDWRERTIIEIFRGTVAPTRYSCILWVQEMFKCEPSSLADEERNGIGGLPDHDFRVDQTASRMAPDFHPGGFEAGTDAEATQKAFDAYCFWLDHARGRCKPNDGHALGDCEGRG
jgi:hypothetical protein